MKFGQQAHAVAHFFHQSKHQSLAAQQKYGPGFPLEGDDPSPAAWSNKSVRHGRRARIGNLGTAAAENRFMGLAAGPGTKALWQRAR